MAGTTVKMSKLKQVLRLHLGGMTNRQIAKNLEINKETVNNYVRKAKADALGIAGLLRLDDYELEHRMKRGNPAYCDERFEVFKEKLPYFKEQLSAPKSHATLKSLWEEYIHDNPDGYSLTQFRFHYHQNTVAEKKITTVLADLHVPGEKVYLDFAGDTMSYIDMETGEVVRTQTFVACFPATDYAYALAVPSQRQEDFVYAFIQFVRSVGGVPKIIVPDNLKAAVIKADRYDPALNQLLEDMANHYEASVLPARSLHPQDKSNVEGQVKIIYHRVYNALRNRTFYSLSELNAAIAERMKAHNQTRMQLKPYTREEQFLAVEKPVLKPLPERDFEIRRRTRLKVQCNGCILLGCDKHYYSIPYQYIGRTVEVDYTRTIVKVYCDGSCIATHERNYAQGKYTIKNEHLASKSQAYRSRSRDYYVGRGMKVMQELGMVIQYMFATGNQPEEVYYNACDGLLALQRRTDPLLFLDACNAALKAGRYNYPFIKNIIESKGIGLRKAPETKAPSPNHENIRGRKAFK